MPVSPHICWTLVFVLPLPLDPCPLDPAGASIKEDQRSGRDPREPEAIRKTEAHTQVAMAGWALCMAMVLAALAGAVRENRHEKFLRQHVDYPRTSRIAAHRYCEIMLMRRQVTASGRPCKPSNTFVHEPEEELVAACSQTPDAAGVHSTLKPMSITACRLRGRDHQNACIYRAQQLQHHVRVNCIKGLPVHLAGTHAPLQ